MDTVDVFRCGYCGMEVTEVENGPGRVLFVGVASGRTHCPEGTVPFHEVAWSAEPHRTMAVTY